MGSHILTSILAALAVLALSAGSGGAQEPRAPRQVSPDIVAPPPTSIEELQRIEPRAPLGELGLAGPVRPRATRHRGAGAVAHAAGRLEVQGRIVTLAGVEVTEPEALCVASSGREWPCGMMARTALRGYLRGRAVTCDGFDSGGDTLNCRRGADDISTWLVRQGWVAALAGSGLDEFEEEARQARRGVFGDPPEALPALAETTGDQVPAISPAPFDGTSSILSEDFVSEGGTPSSLD